MYHLWLRVTGLFILLLAILYIKPGFSSETMIFNGWIHLELGAGNYGAHGVKNVPAPTGAGGLPDGHGYGFCKLEDQYRVLFWTLDQLVSRYGDTGIFHVNDYKEDDAIFATHKLMEYATAKGYHSVVIETIPGDYHCLSAEKNLYKYGRTKYSSVHLKNPELSFYYKTIGANPFCPSEQARREGRMFLQSLANLSDEGLYFFVLYSPLVRLPVEEKTEFMEKDIFYHQTDRWESVPYIFPDGYTIDRKHGRVFAIWPMD